MSNSRKPIMKNPLPLLALLLLTLATPAHLRAAETSVDETEAKEAAEEDAAEEKLDSETIRRLYEGKFAIYPEGQPKENEEVVGIFVSEGKSYFLKVVSPELVKELKPLAGKVVTLNGKIRNKGKYFIAVSVSHSGAAPAFARRRGGI
jgi:hypothetical protein